MSSSGRTQNFTTGNSSPLLTLSRVMFPKGYLTSCSRLSGSRRGKTTSWLSGSLKSFLGTVLLCILASSS